MPHALKAMIVAVLLMLSPLAGRAAEGPRFTVRELAPGVFAAIATEGQPPYIANTGFVIGDDGVLVIDAYVFPEIAEAMLAEIRKRTDKPVRYLVNTHFHLDHVTGDSVFHDAGALVVGHANLRSWMVELNRSRSRPTPEALAIYAKMPRPDIATDQPMSLWLGARRVDIQPATGHTGGDLMVVVPDAKVVFCGDILFRRMVPDTHDGRTRLLIADLQWLQKSGAAAFVPGHGGISTRDDVSEFEGHIVEVERVTADARRAGLAGDALVKVAMDRLRPRYGGWARFEAGQPLEIQAMEEELAGTKTVPQPLPQ